MVKPGNCPICNSREFDFIKNEDFRGPFGILKYINVDLVKQELHSQWLKCVFKLHFL